jgi:hypothetical protein
MQASDYLQRSALRALKIKSGPHLAGKPGKIILFLDPRVEEAGLPGGSKTDRDVWAEFFDAPTNAIDERKLNQEFRRLWQSVERVQVPKPRLRDEVRRLSEKSLEQLLHAYRNRTNEQKPRRRESPHLDYDRDSLVIAITKKRAANKCEIAACTSPLFETDNGETFVEVHHLTPLAQGGADTPENTACLCPTHHREIHHGKLREQLTASLLAVRMGHGY